MPRITKRIATHKRPDADALVAAWIAERFLFSDFFCQVIFIEYHSDLSAINCDCVVDVGGVYSDDQLIFDHKEPAFDDRHLSCAAKLIWSYLLSRGEPVEHLKDLVELVHDGDSSRRRNGSPAYRLSRENGIHRAIANLRTRGLSDLALYRSTRRWLDRRYIVATASFITADQPNAKTRIHANPTPPQPRRT